MMLAIDARGGRVAVLDDFRTLEMVRDGRRTLVRKGQDKGWRNEWVVFSRAVREGGQPPIPYTQLVGVTRATFAAVESLRSGKTRPRLPSTSALVMRRDRPGKRLRAR